MSGGIACMCKPRDIAVLRYRCNYSAFNGYRRTPSAYSTVKCRRCGSVWRTQAAYVSSFYVRQGHKEISLEWDAATNAWTHPQLDKEHPLQPAEMIKPAWAKPRYRG
jgi:hypothetical protein